MNARRTPLYLTVLWHRSLLILALLAFATVGAIATAADRKNADSALHAIKHIILIYQENWSFDSL
jgi:phospholipase C